MMLEVSGVFWAPREVVGLILEKQGFRSPKVQLVLEKSAGADQGAGGLVNHYKRIDAELRRGKRVSVFPSILKRLIKCLSQAEVKIMVENPNSHYSEDANNNTNSDFLERGLPWIMYSLSFFYGFIVCLILCRRL